MAKKEKYDELAKRFLELVGGKENISYFTHCVTRLRVNVKDKGLVKVDEIEAIQNVVATQWSGEQLQIIIGNEVGLAYNCVCEVTGLSREEAVDEQLDDIKPVKNRSFAGILNLFLETISSVIAPFIPAIVGCGLTQGILYSAQMFGWIDATSATYNFLYTCANTAFYFLPILCAFAAGKRFGCNPYLAATLGAFLIHPTIVGMAGETIKLFGLIPITFSNYTSSLIPAILCVYFMSWVEKGLKKIVPSMIDIIVTPLLSLLLASVAGFVLLAPLGGFVGSFVANGMMWLYDKFGLVGGMIISAIYPFILATGMQVAFSPFTVMNLSTLGYDYIYPMTAASNAAMGACALYVYIKARNKNVKALGLSTGITGLIGVTEPVLFGLVLKYKKVLWAVMIGGGVGGAIMGLFTVEYYSFGFVPFGTIMLAFGPTFAYYMTGVVAAMVVSVLALHMMKFED